ncbi:hypothetical protein [Paenibacillus tuaregi]|uniref:hypothetical protein n=1 Tax=Paenibacillus tuaregi TaxID=1816681 RepID=UPI000837F490|nr:hypothetical protein [Paenibacillus tuaregi]
MIFGNRSYTRSPVGQSFVWVAEYYDNTALSEFDWKTKKTNSFYDIDRTKLYKFGLVGEGSQVYFDVANGVFNLNNHRLMLSYIAGGVEYGLTGRTLLYNDIITYKDAVSDAKLTGFDPGGQFGNQIVQYNFGYKKQMELENVNINYQAVFSLPYSESTFLQVKITSDQDLDGKLVIRRNGLIVDEINAPLVGGKVGIINWVIK